tara:strand:+ start:709 stop:1995 length:1287 start_codon:yes stop_codon:yes gene_type:complete
MATEWEIYENMLGFPSPPIKHVSTVTSTPQTTAHEKRATKSQPITTRGTKRKRTLEFNGKDYAAKGFRDPYHEAASALIEKTTTKHLSGVNKHWLPWRKRRNKPPLLLPGEEEENRNELISIIMYFVLEAPNVTKWETVENYLGQIKSIHCNLMFTPSAFYGSPFNWPGDLPSSQISILKHRVKLWFHEVPQEEGGRLPCTPGFLRYLIRNQGIDINTHMGRTVLTLLLLTMLGGFRMGELIPLTKNPELRNIEKDCLVRSVHITTDTTCIKVLSKTTRNLETVIVRHAEVEDLVKEFGEDFNVIKNLREIISNRSPTELLFCHEDGRPITYSDFRLYLRDACDKLNIPRGHFGGHSGRIYLATLLALQRETETYIQERGRWLSNSFKMYVRAIDQRQYTGDTRITHFKLAHLNFVLKGFPNDPEFRK